MDIYVYLCMLESLYLVQYSQKNQFIDWIFFPMWAFMDLNKDTYSIDRFNTLMVRMVNMVDSSVAAILRNSAAFSR